MNNYNKDFLIKRIFFLSVNRGYRENDILLGSFFNKNINKYRIEELEIYFQFLNESDPEIFEWATKKQILPKKYRINLIFDLINNINIED